MYNLVYTIESLYWLFAPGGGQVGKALKGIAKEAPKYADDVARAVAKNPNFFQSIPTWVWVVLGILVVAIVVYRIYEES